MDIPALRNLGAAGVIKLGGGNVQVVFGTFSELIREEIVKTMRKDPRVVLFRSPVAGRMIPLEEVPDPVFAGKVVGEGVAFLPEKGELVAPVAGKVVQVFPTGHAIGIRTEGGLDVLLHVGIDSAGIGKETFAVRVAEGDAVQAGQLLMTFDLGRLRKHAKSAATPMVVTNPDRVRAVSFAPFKHVRRGQASVMSVTLKEEPSHVNRA